MRSEAARPLDGTTDDVLIERLILSLQRAVAATASETALPSDQVADPAPELSTALLNLLAGVVEQASECRTGAGMRRVAKSAGEDLLTLMLGVRDMRGVQ